MADFKWHPDEPPPSIEEHSKAKLDVLRSYLYAYFDRLNINFARDEFKLDLIDGFAGGGTFLDGDEVVSGTPLIMLEESEAAIERLSQSPHQALLRFDFKHYFVDKEAAHTDHLRKVLSERGYQVDDEKINCPYTAGSRMWWTTLLPRFAAVSQEPGARFSFWTNVAIQGWEWLLLPGFFGSYRQPRSF